jgi:hypothetical protein
MTETNIAVFGIYPHRSSCEHAFSAFLTAGFRDVDISVLFQKNPSTNDRNTEEAANRLEVPVAAAVSGAVLGGTLVWLAGSSAVGLTGLEQFFIAGPIVATLAGLALGGTLGSLAGALLGLGVPENKARKYQTRIENGHILLSVHCATSNLVKRAKQLFISTGAEDISSMGELSSGYDTHGA